MIYIDITKRTGAIIPKHRTSSEDIYTWEDEDETHKEHASARNMLMPDEQSIGCKTIDNKESEWQQQQKKYVMLCSYFEYRVF